ncbi:glycosyltransferase [Mangrovivirga sp. M17]|uniref:Glycosyltransferase n=1 Tax=Mangrovivirga halotolerans TaxID=2993936 RepID=A0ABT3RNW5_9BACT|nr:glycosyltransferase [Mangrovivirga halotolerans]MCX2742855.1 glycosyltransferase [Mangrovivirga halotolerans]
MGSLVTVILICYNQRDWVKEAIDSVLNQTYSQVELIVVDVGSSDGSNLYLKNICDQLDVEFIGLEDNIGNCKAFNLAFEFSNGDYVIDLAGDDVLLPERIERGVEKLESYGADFGFHYSDAEYIDEKSCLIGQHSKSLKNLPLEYFPDPFPEGDLFNLILRSYFICPPTMMVRKEVVEKLGGYDESLSFEDFDFWLRAAKITSFCSSQEPLVQKRTVIGSQSNNPVYHKMHASSMVRICKKVQSDLMEPSDDHDAFNKRLEYEMRLCYRRMLKKELRELAEIYKEHNLDKKKSWRYYAHIFLSRMQ